MGDWLLQVSEDKRMVDTKESSKARMQLLVLSLSLALARSRALSLARALSFFLFLSLSLSLCFGVCWSARTHKQLGAPLCLHALQPSGQWARLPKPETLR